MSTLEEVRSLLDVPTLPDASETDYDALLAVLRRWFVPESIAQVARRPSRHGPTLLEAIESQGPRAAAHMLESQMIASRDSLRATGGTS